MKASKGLQQKYLSCDPKAQQHFNLISYQSKCERRICLMRIQQVELMLWKPPWHLPEAAQSTPLKRMIEPSFTDIAHKLEGQPCFHGMLYFHHCCVISAFKVVASLKCFFFFLSLSHVAFSLIQAHSRGWRAFEMNPPEWMFRNWNCLGYGLFWGGITAVHINDQ